MNYWFWIPLRLLLIRGYAAVATTAYFLDSFKFGWMMFGIPASILYFFFQTQEEKEILRKGNKDDS